MLHMRRMLLTATALTAAVALTAPALAMSDAERIQKLEQAIDALKKEVDSLKKTRPAKGKPQPSVSDDRALAQKVEDIEIQQGAQIADLKRRADEVQWIFDNGRPTIRTGDGRFELAIRGRFHFDAGLYAQSVSDNVPFGQQRDLAAGSFFRRSQFGVEGKVFRDYDFEMRYSFGGNGAEAASTGINIMRLAYNVTPEFRVNIGAIQPTFTLSDSVSSNDITFLERPAVVNTVIGAFGGSDSRKGIELTYLQQQPTPGGEWMINVAYTTSAVGTRNATADDRDHLLARFAMRPYADDNTDIHIGANIATVLSMGGNNPGGPLEPARNLSFGDRPELRVDANDTQFVGTGNITAESAFMWGLEAGARYKNFYLAGEYFWWEVSRDRDCGTCNAVAPDPNFSGFYIEGSWILTSTDSEAGVASEFKRYGTQGSGNSRMQFGAPRPASPFVPGGTWGAWELAARYSSIDLDYNANPLGLPGVAGVAPLPNVNQLGAPLANLGEIRGGQQDIWTIGLNWYLNRNVRFMFQFQHVDINRLSSTSLCTTISAVTGACTATTTNPGLPDAQFPNIGQQYNSFAVRTQFAF